MPRPIKPTEDERISARVLLAHYVQPGTLVYVRPHGIRVTSTSFALYVVHNGALMDITEIAAGALNLIASDGIKWSAIQEGSRAMSLVNMVSDVLFNEPGWLQCRMI